jgi:type III restriction enzyme
VQHIVKRNSKTQEIVLKIADGPFRQATEEEIKNLIPIQAYSQKQLSSIGVRIDELKRFVELPVKKDLDQIRSDIRDLATKLRVAYGNLIRKKELDRQVGTYDLEIESLTKQLEGLRSSLTGLSVDDQAIACRNLGFATAPVPAPRRKSASHASGWGATSVLNGVQPGCKGGSKKSANNHG